MVLSKESVYKRKFYGLKNTSYPLFLNIFSNQHGFTIKASVPYTAKKDNWNRTTPSNDT